MLDRISTKNRTRLRVHRPRVIVATERQYADRIRQAAHRAETKRNRRDPLIPVALKLPQSVIDKLISELQVSRAAGDKTLSDKAWRSLIADLIAAIVTARVRSKRP